MPSILHLRGPRALPESRLAKIAAQLKARSLSAEYRYLVETTGELPAGERQLLERLLDDGSPRPAAAVGTLYLVVPRLGGIL